MKPNKRLTAALEWCRAEQYKRHVYVMAGDGDTVKIGRTGNLDQRLACMQSHSGRKLRITFAYECVSPRQASRIECAAHARLKGHRVHGEWFRVTAAQAKTAVVRASNISTRRGLADR